MKKTLIALTVLAGAAATNASAATYAGVQAGNGVGAQYQADLDASSAYRVGVGLGNWGGGIAGNVDYLKKFDSNPIGNGFVPYYGGGAQVGFADGVAISPRAFVGTEYVLNSDARLYAEVGPGFTFYTNGNASATNGLYAHGRVGLNFRLK